MGVTFSPVEVIDDIYSVLSETGEVNYEDLYEQLIEIHEHPIDLNQATEEDLRQLRFLNDQQIDNILLYVEKHPMDSLSELRLVGGLQDYEIRNMLPFVSVQPKTPPKPLYAREVFQYAQHEILTRTDARYIEDPHRDGQMDPIYAQLRYKFNYQNRVQAGATLRRPTGGDAEDLLYGGYISLKQIGAMQSLVLGNYQAEYGQGLVMATPFHTGKSNYVMNVGANNEGMKKYASPDGEGMHGIGTSWRYRWLDAAAWYSLNKPNDSTYKHLVGMNITAHFKRWKIGMTAIENIYSDSLRYYYEHARYNQNYFRGDKQFVGGVNFRWNQGIVDLFGEVATAQNQKWGWGTIVGSRIYPMHDWGLIVLYRYYSPTYDNTMGYAYAETSRINDENGLYIGTDIKLIKHWRITIYGDVFRFDGIKYGIPYRPSYGYDTQAEVCYLPQKAWDMKLKFRAKQKAKKDQFSIRYQFHITEGGWSFNTQADGNIVRDSLQTLSYGTSVFQDIAYTFREVPLNLRLRLQGFYTPDWDNRIYVYEHDVLYAYSTPAIYGEGGRMYLNLRWKIIPQLSLYFRLSETIYTKNWVAHQKLPQQTRTDIHLLLRATL